MNPIKKLLQHTAIYGLSSILGRLLNYFLVPLYTAVFRPEVYGVVTELYAYTGFLMIVLTFGMETGFFRFANKVDNWKELYSTLMLFLAGLSILFVVGVGAFLPSISSSIGYAGQEQYIVFLVLIVVLDAITALPFARLRFENKALRFATIRFLNIGLNIVANLVFILFLPWLASEQGVSIGGLSVPKVSYIFWSNILASGLSLVLLMPHIIDVGRVFNKTLFKQVMYYSLPLLVMGLAGMINETFDRALLKHLIHVPQGTADPNKYVLYQLGIYGANYKLSILMTLFIQAFRYAAEPFFFAQAKNKDADALYARVMNYFTAFCLFVFLVVMLYLDVVKYFIASSYHEGLAVVPILLLANLFLGIVYNLSIWYKLSDRTQFGMWIGLVGAGITILLNLVLVPRLGYMGSAWATLICYGVMALLSYVLSRKYHPIPYKMGQFIGLFVSAAGVYYLAMLGANMELWARLLANTALLVVYLVAVIVLFRKDFSVAK